MTTQTNIRQNIFDASTFDEKNTKFIGGLVAWELSNVWKNPVQNVQTLIQSQGLNTKHMTVPTKKIAIARACIEVARLNTSSDVECKADKGGDDKESYVYYIYKKIRNNQEKSLSFKTETKITYFKETDTVTYEGEFASEVQAMFPIYLECWTDDDLRLFIMKTIRETGSYGTKFRSNGAVYIVPRQGMERVGKLDKVLKEVGAGHIIMLGVPANHEIKFVMESFAADLDERIQTILEQVGKVQKRASSLQGKKEALEECEKLAEIYGEVLNEDASFTARFTEIKKKLDEAANKITEKMTEIATN